MMEIGYWETIQVSMVRKSRLLLLVLFLIAIPMTTGIFFQVTRYRQAIPIISMMNGAPESPMGTLAFSTFLTGNSGTGQLRELAFDSQGNILVVGQGNISAFGFPGVNVHTFGTIDNSSIFVVKLNSNGSNLLWVTLLGGTGTEKGGYGIAVDRNDNVYVAGTTHTSDFPTTPAAWDRTYHGGGNGAEAFLFKLSPDGQNLIYSTYLGGSLGEETARGGLAVDNQGYAYVVGITESSDYLDVYGPNPAKVNAFIGGRSDGFVTKVSQDGSSIIWSRYTGGSNDSEAEAILGAVVDAQGYVYIAQIVRSTDAYVTADAFDQTYNGGVSDTYFMKISPDGTQIIYSTYLGGNSEEDTEHRIAFDGSGNIVFCGVTTSANFPVINAHQPQLGGQYDVYLVKIDGSGQLIFSTFIGGTNNEGVCGGPGIDSQGNIYVVGTTRSAGFEVTIDAFDKTFNGISDNFLQVYSPTGDLLYSTLYGGSNTDDVARSVKIDSQDRPVIVGYTQSGDFPITAGAYDTTFNGTSDVYAMKFDPLFAQGSPTPGPSPTPFPVDHSQLYMPMLIVH